MTPPRHYIGIMTGTSLDGIDAALIRETGGHYHYLAHHEQPMPPALRAALQALCQPLCRSRRVPTACRCRSLREPSGAPTPPT